jgi:hypothetical protein
MCIRLDNVSDVDLSWTDANWIQSNVHCEIERTLVCVLNLLDSFRQGEEGVWTTPCNAMGDYADYLLMKSLPMLQAELRGAEDCFRYLQENVHPKATIVHEDHTWSAHGHIHGYEDFAAFVKHVTIELDDDMGRHAQCNTDSQCESILVSRFQYYHKNPQRDQQLKNDTVAHDGN